ncbi:unnamed protein product [Rotaria sp. Silwood1]|nr:unnamed protein product [Rotaria sp. Silwood1]CAF1664568.1 unnamed protein product [Rotaria sp. Silwood1]
MLQSSSSSSEEELSVHFRFQDHSSLFSIINVNKIFKKNFFLRISLVNEDIECAIVAVQTVRWYPLPEFVLIHKDESVLKDIESLENFRLNVYKVTLSQDCELYDVELHTEPNYPTLGKKFGVKSIAEKIRQMTDTDIEKLLSKGESESPLIIIDDVPIESEGVHFFFRVVKQTQFEAIAKQGCVVLLDYTADAALKDEGRIQEITSRIQKLRKEAFFYVNY